MLAELFVTVKKLRGNEYIQRQKGRHMVSKDPVVAFKDIWLL